MIARQLVGRGPDVWTIFAVGAVACLAAEVLTPANAAGAIVAGGPVLLFLAALFVFAGALERSGALDHLAEWMLRRAVHPESLPAYVFVGFGIAAAVVVNDALILIAIPILYGIGRRLRIDPKPLLLTAAFAVTVGSTLTPMGNPQNLLISVASGLRTPVVTFLLYLSLPVAVSLATGAWYVRRAFGPAFSPARATHAQIRRTALPLWPRGGWSARLRRAPVLAIFPATMALLFALDLGSSLLGTPDVAVWIPIAAGALLLLAVSPGRGPIARAVDLRILALFAGLFVVVAATVSAGVIGALESFLPIAGPSQPASGVLGIVGTSLVGSQLFSNVPWVGLQIPILASAGYGGGTPIAWLALAAGSTLAGNITLLGAASNLILVERAERLGISIRLVEFVRYALPLAAISIGVTVVALLVGL